MEGRRSHLKTHWYAPWVAGWQNLKVFFLFRPDFFLRQPGRVLFALGALLVFGLGFGPVRLAGVELSLYSQVLGLFALALGTSFVGLDALTTVYLRFDRARCARLRRLYDYDFFAPVSAASVVLGSVISARFVIDWVRDNFLVSHLSHGFVAGLGFVLLGTQLFLYTLIVTLFNFGTTPEDDQRGPPRR
jgi:hypothetical protein